MLNNQTALSIVVPVIWNKPEQIKRCFSSIFTMRQKNVELIIIDQGNLDCVQKVLTHWKRHLFIYKRVTFSNKSKALNLGTKLATSDIVAYTDHDCIVDKNWADAILDAFKKHPEVSAVTGNVLPYRKTRVGSKKCPATFQKYNSFLITQPTYHYSNIGIGSNFSFRKKIFQQVGDFKKWLGPGSNAFAAEDGEMLLRLLTRGFKIWFSHKAIVYHDKWLDTKAFRKQVNQYTIGGMACYGYFYYQHFSFAKSIIYNSLKKSFTNCLTDLKKLKISPLKQSLELIQSQLIGLRIGFFNAFYERIHTNCLLQKKLRL